MAKSRVREKASAREFVKLRTQRLAALAVDLRGQLPAKVAADRPVLTALDACDALFDDLHREPQR